MQSLFIHALSCTNLSGRQVLCGHVAELLRHAEPSCRFTLLLHAGNADIVKLLTEEWGGPLPERLSVRYAPAWTAHWAGRAVYERTALPMVVRSAGADALLSLSGGWIRGLLCRQYTLALNPWAFIPEAIHGPGQRLKARLQRHSYRLAVRHLDGIGYASDFMRGLYRRNAGREERAGFLIYPALSRAEVAAMNAVRATEHERDRDTILCVSLMAAHKDIATLLRAFHRLVVERRCPARLRLVGGWADAGYRRAMEELARELTVGDRIEFDGHVGRDELRRAYRSARVYCLLSRSESFGIPAVEAQWMGTPVVAAKGCAAPEVCGAGGWYVEPGDVAEAARLLQILLTDGAQWRTLSIAAEQNARRFEYRHTARALFDMIGINTDEGAR